MISYNKLSAKHRKTLEVIFERPERPDIAWRDIESLLVALGGEVSEGSGSRARVALGEVRAVFHRPHPERITDKGAVKSVRRFFAGRRSGTMIEYKGYLGRVEYDDEAGIFHGEVINLRDVITFQGETVHELRTAFQDSVDDYLAFCAERGEEPERPYSGTFTVRIPPELHRDVALQARLKNKSLNSWVTELLSEATAARSNAAPSKGRRAVQSAAAPMHMGEEEERYSVKADEESRQTDRHV